MVSHSVVQLAWYFPLPEVLLGKKYLTKKFLPIYQPFTEGHELKELKGYVRNLGRLQFISRTLYPLLMKDGKVRILKEVDYPPIFYARTPYRKRKYQFSQNNSLEKEITLRSSQFSVKVYPFGLGVINCLLNFKGLIDDKQLEGIRKNLLCGKEASSLEKYVNYLKFQTIKSLFREEQLTEIQTAILGPKICVNIIAPKLSREEFHQIACNLLIRGVNEPKVMKGREEKDQLAFHKTGIVFSIANSPAKEAKRRRNYLRKQFDFVMDLVFGTEVLLPILPTFLSKYSLENVPLERVIAAAFTSLNPKIIAAKREIESLLPTAALRKWYKESSEQVNLWKVFVSEAEEIVARLPELRIDHWLKIVNNYLLSSTPKIRELIKESLNKAKYPPRELLALKPELKGKRLELFNFLYEKFETQLIQRFVDGNKRLDEEDLGYCTISKISENIGMGGRKYGEVKMTAEIMLQVGLLQAKPYRGPGSREDSKKYRVSIIHPYINARLKNTLADQLISTSHLDLL